jgi:23S rRNA (cytosine1962-C5)-methyltransferase
VESAIVQALLAETGCPNVFERCDELIRKSEGLPVFSRAGRRRTA